MPKPIHIQLFYHSKEQEEVFNAPERNIVVPAGRRWGKTQGGFIKLVDAAFQISDSGKKSGVRILWVDTTQANIGRYIDTG